MIFQILTHFSKYTLFVDDSTLSCTFINTDEVHTAQTLNSELKLIDDWLTSKKVKVNHTKSKLIVFSYRKSISLSPLQCGSNTISQTDSIRFLGMDPHAVKYRNKCRVNLQIE